ncbi:MAG TPA: PIN domain-containing protein [Acidobacteriota bacterium]|nr:PIN domain-containing protein [Acidobacteriota bacterium]
MVIFIFRILVIAIITSVAYFLPPFGLSNYYGAAAGFIVSVLIVLLEVRIKKSPFRTIWGVTAGFLCGLFIGWLLGMVYQTILKDQTAAFFKIFFLIIFPYMGFLIGLRKPEWFSPTHLFSFFKEKNTGRENKILDTSVIIDGRISDIADAYFIEGNIIVPQFVLKELQLVADSSDGVKRQRGRRGLDVLDRLQKSSHINVSIFEEDFPEIKEVDSKLIELAKQMDAKIITNDFNLNKIAQLQGIQVLNINELANALKPVVLPGEKIKAFILKEGKEKDQGVAYLDDGTMVVVDNSRKMVGHTIDVTVTSVLQTTVGKMIFGRYEEDS